MTPTPGVIINRSVRLTPGRYAISPIEPAILVIHGNDIEVDCTGVELIGADAGTAPDQFTGTAVRVAGGRNITIKNLTARGYKTALFASDCRKLDLSGCDFSNNYRPRLKSTPQREDESDWLSFHHNEQDEWLRYGAGIYLRDCDEAQVHDCTVMNGQNGLMLTRCDDGKFWGNDFSFNSGVGIGMYRSSRNSVMNNRCDWCIRGYSHGVYNRGQDSAGILVYEQSCRNTIAFNSATHSGDGLFLWAGQSTMDTGRGGCNDNLIYGNDFSCASNNGIEVTFSRNVIVNNRLVECDYGIWGGYSFQTQILANQFARNRVGIAIEHGQDNTIATNTFDGDRLGIKLWADASQDPNWEYPKRRDTRSRDYLLFGNVFTSVAQPMDVRDTANVHQPDALSVVMSVAPKPIRGAPNVLLDDAPARRLGREFIVIDEWGPRRDVISMQPGSQP